MTKDEKPVACGTCGRQVLPSRLPDHSIYARDEHELKPRHTAKAAPSQFEWAYNLLREQNTE